MEAMMQHQIEKLLRLTAGESAALPSISEPGSVSLAKMIEQCLSNVVAMAARMSQFGLNLLLDLLLKHVGTRCIAQCREAFLSADRSGRHFFGA